MNPGIIATYLDKRMQEIGHCAGYAVRIRDFVLAPLQTLQIASWNEIFILLGDAADMRVESDLGVYDNTNPNATSEQQHEHTGKIILTNLSDSRCNVQFVQGIPLEENSDCPGCNPQ